MRCGSRCEKSSGAMPRIVPPFFAPGTSAAGPVESAFVPTTTEPVYLSAPPCPAPPPFLAELPLLHAERTIEPCGGDRRGDDEVSAGKGHGFLLWSMERDVRSGGPRRPAGGSAVQRLVFGSSASRTESPSRLKAMTKITIVTPGKSMNVMSLW